MIRRLEDKMEKNFEHEMESGVIVGAVLSVSIVQGSRRPRWIHPQLFVFSWRAVPFIRDPD